MIVDSYPVPQWIIYFVYPLFDLFNSCLLLSAVPSPFILYIWILSI